MSPQQKNAVQHGNLLQPNGSRILRTVVSVTGGDNWLPISENVWRQFSITILTILSQSQLIVLFGRPDLRHPSIGLLRSGSTARENKRKGALPEPSRGDGGPCHMATSWLQAPGKSDQS